MNDLELLRDMHTQVPEPSVDRLSPGRDRLLAACRTAAARPHRFRPPHRGWQVGLAGAIAATLTAALILLQTDGGLVGKTVLPRTEAAADVLYRAAAVAEVHPDPIPRGDQYIYTEVLQRSGPPGGPWKTYQNRGWTSADGTRYGLDYEHGRRMSEGTPGAKIPQRTKGGVRIVHPPGYADFSKMPRDPGRLVAYLRRSDRGLPQTYVAQNLTTILSYPVLPPGLRAAAFRALATLPGTTVRRDVTDASGRHGIGFVRMERTESAPAEDIMILDPRTYRYLGERRTYVEDVGRDGVQRGQRIVDWTAAIRTGIVDRPGQKP